MKYVYFRTRKTCITSIKKRNIKHNTNLCSVVGRDFFLSKTSFIMFWFLRFAPSNIFLYQKIIVKLSSLAEPRSSNSSLRAILVSISSLNQSLTPHRPSLQVRLFVIEQINRTETNQQLAAIKLAFAHNDTRSTLRFTRSPNTISNDTIQST